MLSQESLRKSRKRAPHGLPEDRLGAWENEPRGTRARTRVRLLPHKRISGLFERDGEYIADIKPDGGGRITRKLGPDRDRAFKLFDDLLSELEERAQADDRENPIVVDFLRGTFLATQRDLKSPKFAVNRVNAICRFLEREHTGLRLRDLQKPHGDELVRSYAHLSPKTRKDNLQKLKQAVNYAVDLSLLDANPLAGCRAPRFDNRRQRVPSMDEFCQLVTLAETECRSDDIADILGVLALTGLRPSNVFALHRDEVDGDLIRIPPAKMKNGRWGEIPASRHVLALLAGREPDPYYFPSRDTRDMPRTSIKKAWERLRRGVVLEWMQVYDLRHFFGSQLAKHGASEQQIARLLCHRGQTVTSRYVHHDIEDLRLFVDDHGERVRVALGGLTPSLGEGAPALRV